jgi:hypothetical protein
MEGGQVCWPLQTSKGNLLLTWPLVFLTAKYAKAAQKRQPKLALLTTPAGTLRTRLGFGRFRPRISLPQNSQTFQGEEFIHLLNVFRSRAE